MVQTQERIYIYFDRNPQLHVLFIFDQMGMIINDLEDATWKDGYIYHIFDGAWFNTKYNIEKTWKDKHVVLLFTQDSYPHTEQQQLAFPLLDMLKANMEYKEEDYASFMQQYNLPEKFRVFIKKNIVELTSSKVSSILNGYISAETFSEDVACRGIISYYLGSAKLYEWDQILVRMTILETESEQRKYADFISKVKKSPDVKRAIDKKLLSLISPVVSSQQNYIPKVKDFACTLKYNSITQLLSTSNSDNYKEFKVTNAMVLDQLNKVYEYGTHDRQYSEKFVSALNELADQIKEEEIIKVYGIDAQYFYLTENLCWPILKELMENQLLADPASVNERMRELTLKMPADTTMQVVVKFVENVALYYDKVRSLGTLKLNTPEDYVRKYINEFYLVDMFYRHALESYHTLVTKPNPIEQTISSLKQQLDQDYAKVANVFNLEWMTCVVERNEAFRGLSLSQQHQFYSLESDTTTKQVIIISDALRYEVASELLMTLSKEKHVATLNAYLAMLPTETKYCKPSLLPHHSLDLRGTDLAVDDQVLATLEQRTSQLNKYREGAVCVRYEQVMNGDTKAMRELFKKPLVYIFHDTIDEASHSQNPFEVIGACRKAIDQLAVLISRLHATWNVTNVALTADHGFIYNDIVFEDKDKHSIADSCFEKKTRYYLTENSDPVEGVAKFQIENVSGMSTTCPTYVAVPMGTNRFAASGGYSFAHGGASLQELIIPVIKSVRKKVDKTEKVGVALMNHNLSMVSSRLKFQIIQSEAVSMNVVERTVICVIYNGDEAVTELKELKLNSADAVNLNNRVYELTLNLNKSVTSSVLQLRVYDKDDLLNPIIKETVKNNTMIEQDF